MTDSGNPNPAGAAAAVTPPSPAPAPTTTPRPAANPALRMSVEKWNAVLAAMREQPGVISYAARQTGISRDTIRKLWNVGHPTEEWGKRPMRDIITAEQTIARARHSERQRAMADLAMKVTLSEAESAREKNVQIRSEELKMSDLARANVLGVMAAAVHLSDCCRSQAKAMAKDVMNLKLSPTARLDIIQRTTIILERAVRAGLQVAELQRIVGGDPSRAPIPGEGADDSVTTLEDAIREVENVRTIQERMRELGISVLEGGAAAEQPGTSALESDAIEGPDAPSEPTP